MVLFLKECRTPYTGSGGTAEVLEQEAPIKEAFEILNQALLTEAEAQAYLQRQEFLINNIGFQEEVREEGREEQKVLTAKNLLSAGIDRSIIMQATGLSIEQLNNIATTQ